ncbi:MAG: M23 family metallopeptidase [Oscillospiraceae bacterium]|nr:M23 family metallopeptidase [Oscillospiraceae bacterium]
MVDPVTVAKAAVTLLSNEKTRKGIGWAVVAILSPIIVVAALLCVLGSGAVSHNISAAQLCFQDGPLPDDIPAEYRVCIEEMRVHFAELDESISAIEAMIEDDGSLDPIRVKAVFFSLYFGGEAPLISQFANCFAASEIRVRTVTETDDEGNEIQVDQIYTAAVPIGDMDTVYANITASLGGEITEEQKSNADDVYSLIKYGYPASAEGGGFAGADAPFVGADGFCSPVGANWRNIITSEFGSRRDPITGERRGHNGMDLAVPTGTPVRAALDGTVRSAKYDSSYGYYVSIDHGGGLVTLYAHNSRLLVHAGQTVKAGDVVSLSGSTGRSTGPHLHFEVRINGERTNPRFYLP